MTSNILLFISLGKLGLLWLIMYLLIICISHIGNKKTFRSKEELKKSLILTRVYLDQYYISNKIYTFFMTSIYILGTIIIFILLKYAYLGYMIRQIDYQQLIDSKVTLKDLQVYIKLLLDTYQLNELFQQMIIKTLTESFLEQRNAWYILLRNVLLIGAITTTLINIKNIILIINQLITPYGTQMLMKDVYMTTFHNKITYVKAYEMFINMLEKLKSFL